MLNGPKRTYLSDPKARIRRGFKDKTPEHRNDPTLVVPARNFENRPDVKEPRHEVGNAKATRVQLSKPAGIDRARSYSLEWLLLLLV